MYLSAPVNKNKVYKVSYFLIIKYKSESNLFSEYLPAVLIEKVGTILIKENKIQPASVRNLIYRRFNNK